MLVSGPIRRLYTENNHYVIPVLDDGDIRFIKSGYVTVVSRIHISNGKHQTNNIIMETQSNSWWEELWRQILTYFGY